MTADLCPACGVSLPRDLMPTHLARAHPDRRGPPSRGDRVPTPPPTEAYEGDVTAPRSMGVSDGPGPTAGGTEGVPEPPAPAVEEASPPPVLEEILPAPVEGVEGSRPSSGPDPEDPPPSWSLTGPGPGEDGEKRSEGSPHLEPDVPIPSRKALRTAFQRRRQQTNRSLAQAEALLVGFPSGSSRRVQRRAP